MDSKRYRADRESAACPELPSLEPVPLPREEELSERFRGRLRMFATRRLGDADAAEDVAQETLRRVMDALRAGRVVKPAAFPAYVFETARHLCLQHYRSAYRKQRALRRLKDDVNARADGPPDPLSALVSETRAVRVRAALAELAENDRELLRLLYHEELETHEAAARVGLSAATLRVRKHRALKRLGELLETEDI